MSAVPIAALKGIDQGRANVLADQVKNQAGLSGSHSRIYKHQAQSRRSYRSSAAPLSWLPHFERLHRARTLLQLHDALHNLVPMLVKRGQQPECIGRDLTELLRTAGLHDQVLPIVHCALQGRKGTA